MNWFNGKYPFSDFSSSPFPSATSIVADGWCFWLEVCIPFHDSFGKWFKNNYKKFCLLIKLVLKKLILMTKLKKQNIYNLLNKKFTTHC